MIEWNRLRAIGNSSVAKSAIAVPILGYFVLFNDPILHWLRLHAKICAPDGCDILWRLVCLYFGGCAFALGAIIYGLFCPAPIKKYGDAADYFAGEREIFHAHPSGGKKDRAETTDSDLRDFAVASWERLERSRRVDAPKKPAGYDEHRATKIAVDSQLSYSAMNKATPLLRSAVAILYVAGSLFLATPTIWTFGEVIVRLLNRPV